MFSRFLNRVQSEQEANQTQSQNNQNQQQGNETDSGTQSKGGAGPSQQGPGGGHGPQNDNSINNNQAENGPGPGVGGPQQQSQSQQQGGGPMSTQTIDYLNQPLPPIIHPPPLITMYDAFSTLLRCDVLNDPNSITICCHSCFEPSQEMRDQHPQVHFVPNDVSVKATEELSEKLFSQANDAKGVFLLGVIYNHENPASNDLVGLTRLLRTFDSSAEYYVPPLLILSPYFHFFDRYRNSNNNSNFPNSNSMNNQNNPATRQELERKILDKSKLFAQYGADDILFWNVLTPEEGMTSMGGPSAYGMTFGYHGVGPAFFDGEQQMRVSNYQTQQMSMNQQQSQQNRPQTGDRPTLLQYNNQQQGPGSGPEIQPPSATKPKTPPGGRHGRLESYAQQNNSNPYQQGPGQQQLVYKDGEHNTVAAESVSDLESASASSACESLSRTEEVQSGQNQNEEQTSSEAENIHESDSDNQMSRVQLFKDGQHGAINENESQQTSGHNDVQGGASGSNYIPGQNQQTQYNMNTQGQQQQSQNQYNPMAMQSSQYVSTGGPGQPQQSGGNNNFIPQQQGGPGPPQQLHQQQHQMQYSNMQQAPGQQPQSRVYQQQQQQQYPPGHMNNFQNLNHGPPITTQLPPGHSIYPSQFPPYPHHSAPITMRSFDLNLDVELSLIRITNNLEVMRKQMSASQAMSEVNTAYVTHKVAQFADLLWKFIPQRVLTNFPPTNLHIRENECSVGDFKFVSKLGEGMLGKVYKAVPMGKFNQDKQQEIFPGSGEFPMNRSIAVKKIPKAKIDTGSELEALYREYRILFNALDHPGIVRLYGMLVSQSTIYLIMQHAGKLSLFEFLFREEQRNIKSLQLVERLKRKQQAKELSQKQSESSEAIQIDHRNTSLDIEVSQQLFRQICAALTYCHYKQVCHRDLKPENFIVEDDPTDGYSPSQIEGMHKSVTQADIDSGHYPGPGDAFLYMSKEQQDQEVAHHRFNLTRNIKIADFGLAAICKVGQRLNTQCGSMPFASPELMSDKSYCGFKCDVWSAGVVLLEILCKLNKFEKIMNWPRDGSLLATPQRAIEVEQKFSCCTGILDQNGSSSSSRKNRKDSINSQNSNNDNESRGFTSSVELGGPGVVSSTSSFEFLGPNHENKEDYYAFRELRDTILSDLSLKNIKNDPEGTKGLLHVLLNLMFIPKPNRRATMMQIAASKWVGLGNGGFGSSPTGTSGGPGNESNSATNNNMKGPNVTSPKFNVGGGGTAQFGSPSSRNNNKEQNSNNNISLPQINDTR